MTPRGPMTREKAGKIYTILKRTYPGSHTALEHKGPWELLVATILSAQCTDARVNKVTPSLFRKYPAPEDIARARKTDLEKIIRSTGFYHNKATNIINAARVITEKYKGMVPRSMEKLVELPGVARKTANIVLYHSFGIIDGIAVDTHVKRLSYRMGLTLNTDPVKIERDLMAIFDRKEWGELSDTLIQHGRTVCKARKPDCVACPVRSMCPSAGYGGRPAGAASIP